MTLAEFFLALATDRELLERFSSEPEAVGREHGLSEKQLGLLLAGDLRAIRVNVEVEIQIGDEVAVFETVHTAMPTGGTVHLTDPPPKG